MRELFFARQTFSLQGEGEFAGTFHIYRGGRRLAGTFSSASAGVNDFEFTALEGELEWLPRRFVVPRATARFYGGDIEFSYAMDPLGVPDRPAIARFDTTYADVQLAEFTDFLEVQGLRLAGALTGHTLLEWPLGRFADRRGEGDLTVTPPPGARVLPRIGAAQLVHENEDARFGVEEGPFSPHTPVGYVPVEAAIRYRFEPGFLELAPGHVVTSDTFVEFQGRTEWGARSRIPFHVLSSDWQESDRLLAGVLTAFGTTTRAVPIGGYGEFNGIMLGEFRRPRIEGRFEGAGLRAWDVDWGRASAEVAIENNYVDVTDAVIRDGSSEIRTTGRFSLGYPRRDGGEELNARFSVNGRDLADLRRAFSLDDYRLEGRFSGDFHLYGRYERPFGFGRMSVNEGVAYGESFDHFESELRFEGAGVRLDGASIRKGEGVLTGAAFIGWTGGTYSFNADGRRLPIERIDSIRVDRAPLSGLLDFSAEGSGTFDEPRYDVEIEVADLFMADEGVGAVTATLAVRGDLLTVAMDAASPRLTVSGTGRVSLNEQYDTEATFRFTDTSLDPYLRIFEPRLSPFTTAVASGAIRVVGELGDVNHLLVDGTVDTLRLGLFDYPLSNAGPLRVALDRNTILIDRARLVGEGTELDLDGSVDLGARRIEMKATGRAALAVLQGFFRDLRSSGQAGLQASISGPLDAPTLAGSASVTDGRVRHFSLPHSLENLDGRITFDERTVRFDELTARVGGGLVQFGGRVAFTGLSLGDINVTAVGQDMRIRYPEGVRSLIDADLTLRGAPGNPLLTGTVTVKSAEWTERIDTGGNLLELTGSGGSASAPAVETLPVRFDVRIVAPGTLRVENNAARLVLSADLVLGGTYDRPTIFGRAEVDRGEVLFEARRYFVTRGSVDFSNPARIEPFFDVEAETRVRVPGQTYRVILRAAGTPQRLDVELNSDPPLSQVDIVSLLFGDVRPTQDSELNALRTQDVAEQQLLQSRAARMLASPISSGVGRVVEQTFGVDTFQITPSLVDPYQQSSRLNPSARLTIGKRISDRVYLTYARSLTESSRDQIILLEFDQSDRLSWILTQNEDNTYSIDVRVRHTF
jgi:translocation and assembly module TamB